MNNFKFLKQVNLCVYKYLREIYLIEIDTEGEYKMKHL